MTDASGSLSNPASRDFTAWGGLFAAGIVILALAAAGPWIIHTRGYEVFIPLLVLSPYHEDALIDALAEALVDVWQRLSLPLKDRALAAE